MILLTHILIAIASILYTTYVVVSPTRTKIRTSYGLVTLTLISGTYLIISSHAALLQACLSGLLYTCTITVALAFARNKLASATHSGTTRHS